jgi:hypothetical protein
MGIETWPPPGWDSWAWEQRRIWRLEQQLFRWEIIGLAARDYAQSLAADLASSRGQTSPTSADVTYAILGAVRERIEAEGAEWTELPDEDQ